MNENDMEEVSFKAQKLASAIGERLLSDIAKLERLAKSENEIKLLHAAIIIFLSDAMYHMHLLNAKAVKNAVAQLTEIFKENDT